ncbi:MAG TPA: peptidase E [Elusimicrobiales bacterium]|nr:peptidase E [Elusimicrobiales bacterium]
MDLKHIKLVAIGGGEIANKETLPVDKFIVDFAGRRNPRVLFIPTATSDSQVYVDRFRAVYEKELSCRTNVLRLTDAKIDKEEIERSISETDVIYVGGGDTGMMMDVWRERGVDKILSKAMAGNGIVFAGLSAGAICWFKEGLTDVEAGKETTYQKIKGLGLINGLFCPHFNIWEEGLASCLPGIGVKSFIAADNCAALVLDNGATKIVSANPASSVYRVTVEGNKLVKRDLR